MSTLATSPADRLWIAGVAARTAAHLAWEGLARRQAEDPREAPNGLTALTAQWLTGALAKGSLDARVSSFRLEPAGGGTSERARIHLSYEGADRGSLPVTAFAKATPGLLTRLANGASGTSACEAGFYAELRPLLDVGGQAPVGYHSAFEQRSFRSIHLLEDLVATQGAEFATLAWRPTLAQARVAISLLAELHRTFRGTPLPAWVRTYPRWWADAMRVADVRKPTLAFAGHEACPAALSGRGEELWRSCVGSIEIHRSLESTLVHGDAHLGNWYVTASGEPGLADWQCVSRGHWALDVAYALSTMLPADDRRRWERELLRHYLEVSGMPEGEEEAWLRYRQQIPGALLKWTPVLSPPRGLPEMQPPELARALLGRIAEAYVDLEPQNALREEPALAGV